MELGEVKAVFTRAGKFIPRYFFMNYISIRFLDWSQCLCWLLLWWSLSLWWLLLWWSSFIKSLRQRPGEYEFKYLKRLAQVRLIWKKDNFFMILILILLTLPDGWRRSSPGHCIEKVTSFHSVGRFNFWEPTLLFSPSSNPGHCVKMSPQFISSLESDFKYWKQTRKRQMHQASTNKVFKEIRTKLNEPDIKIGLS